MGQQLSTQQTISQLKQDGHDFEWYPTPDYIIDLVIQDFLESNKSNQDKLSTSGGLVHDLKLDLYASIVKNVYRSVVLDIGAGDGRFLNKAQDLLGSWVRLHAIEKASIHQRTLIKLGIPIIGSEFHTTTLLNNKVDLTFCNPPYSEFDVWMQKIVTQLDSNYIYFIVPNRYKNNKPLLEQIDLFYNLTEIHEFSFNDAERQARANVSVLRLTRKNTIKQFDYWVDKNIGKLDTKSDKESEQELNNSLATASSFKDKIDLLVDRYNNDLASLSKTYQALSSINSDVLATLNIDRKLIIGKLEYGLQNLRTTYWNKTINELKEITSRFTFKYRRDLIDKVTAKCLLNNTLDFTRNNVKMLLVFLDEHYAIISEEQAEYIAGKLIPSNDKGWFPYKSNERWATGDWRTNIKGNRFKLDYRFIVPNCYLHRGDGEYVSNEDCLYNNIIYDLMVLANTFGYTIEEPNYDTAGFFNFKHFGSDKIVREVHTKSNGDTIFGEILFSFKYYQKNTVHFKLRKEFMLRLNVFIGKSMGWLTCSEDVVNEFDVSKDKADQLMLTVKTKLVELQGANNFLQLGSD